ncbi:MAG: kynureninase [Candidatus Neomarinimicrobiota bacterium]
MPARTDELSQHPLDARDPLARFREQFAFDEAGPIYLNGNSLGRQPKAAVDRTIEVLDQWGSELVRGWSGGWIELTRTLGEKLAPLVGAGRGRVVLSDSTSLNLYKLALAALEMRPERTVILSDELNFPSDLYVLQGCVRQLGGHYELRLVPSTDGITIDQQTIIDAITEETALVCLSHVAYRSAFMYDAAAITAAAHQAGALVLWDLSHSVGVAPIKLDAWDVDFAVGCTYKYLNGGPGSPAFVYARPELAEQALSPVWGWLGHRSPFSFEPAYQPAEGVTRFQAGTPPILALAALEPGLDLTLEAGISAIREKSLALTGHLIDLAERDLAPVGFSVGTPREDDHRGSHVSLRHPEAYRISRALIEEQGVLVDFREPDGLRMGLAPLYNTFAEVEEAVARTHHIVAKEHFKNYSLDRAPVT